MTPKLTKESWSIHPSYKKNLIFQRLEFFGDKIIAFEISKILLLDQRLTEGQLSIVLSSLVCRDTMAKIGEFLVPDIKYTGILTVNMIASTLEAWIGYHFLMKQDVSKIIEELWTPYLFRQFSSSVKNILQEYAQQHNTKPIYHYKYENSEFLCMVDVCGYHAEATGISKKKASENAAKILCKTLNLL